MVPTTSNNVRQFHSNESKKMTENTDKIKKTIRDLFNLAENDAAAEGEVENAIRFARRLLDKHHLSEEECRKDPTMNAARSEVMEENGCVVGNGKLAYWEKQLGGFVQQFVGSVGCYLDYPKEVKIDGRLQFGDDGKPLVARRVVFFGVAEDAAMASNLYKTLQLTIATMARFRYGGAHRGDGRTYCEGYVSGLYSKLREAVRIDSIDSESRALVVQSTALAKASKERAIAWRERVTGRKLRAGNARSVGASDPNAYNQGKADGAKTGVSASRTNKVTGEQQRRLS